MWLHRFKNHALREHATFLKIVFQKHCFSVKCANFHVLKKTLLPSKCTETPHALTEHGPFFTIFFQKHCFSVKCASFHVLAYVQKHDGLSPKPNHVCKLCDYTCSIKQVLAMHMNKEHNGAAPLQKSCNIGPFISHLSGVLKNHIKRKHQCIEKKHLNVISVIFLPRAKLCLSITNILSMEKKPA